MIKNSLMVSLCFFVFSCSSLIKYEKTKKDFKTEEFDKKVKIVEVLEPPEIVTENPADVTDLNTISQGTPEVGLAANSSNSENTQSSIKSKTEVGTTTTKNKKTSSTKSKIEKVTTDKKTIEQKSKFKKSEVQKIAESKAIESKRREPEIEDSEGFDNQRRPLADPFRVGEKVVHDVSYLGASAGTLTLAVKPFAVVNGQKNYNFFIDLKSNSVFSRLVYAIDDQVQTYVDYETLTPGAFKVDIRDSGQVKEARSYFDFVNLTASYWEHRYTEKSGHEEKKLNWSILPYSQNPFSSVFYMRVFKWTVGKEYIFRVADDEKNIFFKATALEKTVLSTDIGDFPAIKLKAEVISRGNLSKAKDFFMWISDDDRKYVLRIEVKLPIGALVSEVIQIKKGYSEAKKNNEEITFIQDEKSDSKESSKDNTKESP